MRFSYVDWIAMVVNPFFSFNSALEKKKKSRKWVDSFPFRNTYTGFYCHSNGHSTFRFHFLFSTNFTQLSQTFNLSLRMATSSARVFFPIMRLQDPIFYDSIFYARATFCAQIAVDSTQRVDDSWKCPDHFSHAFFLPISFS